MRPEHRLSLFRWAQADQELNGNHPPVPTEPGAVPTDNGFGRDDEECLLPA